MHLLDESTQQLTDAIVRYAVDRTRMDPPPLDHGRTAEELAELAGPTITEHGIGGEEALRIFEEVLAPSCISVDHPRFLSFVPAAPTESSILFDLVVGASCIYAGSWLEGAGAVHAENEALRYVADLAGFPPQAGGVFVSGGTAGNLSALIAARHSWREKAQGRHDRTRGLIISSGGSHSSIASAGRAMDADVISVEADEQGRLRADALEALLADLAAEDLARTFAVVATCGTTNAGVIDDMAAVAAACARLGVWMHVDGAYGGAGLAVPSIRHRYAGVERADSFIVDPHKWLFAPFDSCALVYRDPAVARRAHTQHAEYLDVLHGSGDDHRDWNPSDYAHHLTRRARGLPFWFSLATHGTAAYSEAVETTLRVAHDGARLIADAPHLELIAEPELSVVMFRRLGWRSADYAAWSARLLLGGSAFVTPSAWRGETILRICIVNPRTTVADVALLIESLAEEPAR